MTRCNGGLMRKISAGEYEKDGKWRLLDGDICLWNQVSINFRGLEDNEGDGEQSKDV